MLQMSPSTTHWHFIRCLFSPSPSICQAYACCLGNSCQPSCCHWLIQSDIA